MGRIASACTSGLGSSVSLTKDYEPGLRFGIVHEIEIDEFLLFEVIGLHILEDLGE